MSELLQHRGPDGEGLWSESGDLINVYLLHRLLKMQSNETHAGPYISRDHRYVLTFNGEIYNWRTLARELRLTNLESDATVLLEGWAQFGEAYLEQINGMFAFALFDRVEQKLFLVRDRCGEKPLYYSNFGAQFRFAFASEIRALLALFVQSVQMNREAASEYLRYRYVSGKLTMFNNIYKLRPGELLTVDRDLKIESRRYWQPPNTSTIATAASTDNNQHASALSDHLEASFAMRLQSIHPAALFLSGGVDSALIASHMPPGSLALTFGSRHTLDETIAAKALAQRFGLQFEVVESQVSFEESVDTAIHALEEPLGDSIILPTVELARAAARNHRLVLSGEGADEIFGGYLHHQIFATIEKLKGLAGPLSLNAARFALRLASDQFLNAANPFPADLARDGRVRIENALCLAASGQAFGGELTFLFKRPHDSSEHAQLEREAFDFKTYKNIDLATFLPDYTALRVDKILMHFGIEGRLPYLDHKVVETAASLPVDQLIGFRQRKIALRRLAEKRLGREFAWQKKTPFLYNLASANAHVLNCLRGSISFACEHHLISKSEAEELEAQSRRPDFVTTKKLFALYAFQRWAVIFKVDLNSTAISHRL